MTSAGCVEGNYPECLLKYFSRLEPSEEQREKISKVADQAIGTLHKIIESRELQNIIHEVSIHGSFARDTWLPEDVDIDIFILFDERVGVEDLRKITEALSAQLADRLGAELETRFAAHPYFVVKYRGVELELVPAYKVEKPEEMKSAVDRTPFHTDYVVSQLRKNPGLKRDIRIFKALLRRLNIYGAEAEVKGFSGYLSEVLIIHFGGLTPLLRAVAKWVPWRVVIPESAQKLRGSAPLVVLDPVDPRRNAAAAVGVEQLSKLIAFANTFTYKPEILCCILEDLEEEVEYTPDGDTLILRLRDHPPLVQDALAGKISRVLDSVTNTLQRYNFKVLRKLYLKLEDEHLLVFQLEALELPIYEKKIGPPVWHKNIINFLSKWASNLPAPFVEGDRAVVVAPRKIRRAIDTVKEVLRVYRGFEWEIHDAPSFLEGLAQDKKYMLLKALAGYEPWIICLRRCLGGSPS
ncbi:CCA tRNA nucleotidyltransferase [Infirmifilum lucidum]|uniref:CCA-adding enzyme n=1 Tax=Infirmifilum lucidum TaxID=2776706 RepID=A0A7L9FHL5_9CREN|nr:CCA tRNA nucleotidyltransferase [Infirmifilum lucidum]QOJ78265.1 CCA tRNA nucleotidyltransferase [Infirmifilum lucidum]